MVIVAEVLQLQDSDIYTNGFRGASRMQLISSAVK